MNLQKVKAKMMLDIIRRIDPFSPDKNLTVGVLQHKNKNMRNLADALITLADQENVDLAVSIDGWLTPRDSIAYAFLKQLLTIACHPADKKARVFLDMLTFDVEESKSPEILSIEDIACKLGFDNVSSIEQLSKAIRNDVFLNGTHGFVERFINAFKENLRNFDLKRLYTVRDLAAAYNGTPDEFIDAIEDWLHTQDQSVKKTVQFMTIHKAKGLEFDVVFLPDTEGNPPHSVAPEYARNAEITNGVRWINYLPTKSI